MRKRNLLMLLLGLSVVLVFSGCTNIFSFLGPKTADVSGTVKDTDGVPVVAVVTLGDEQILTDISGNFVFKGVEKGKHSLVVKVGNESLYTESVDVSGKDVQVDAKLSVVVAHVSNLLANPTWEAKPGVMPLGWSEFDRTVLGDQIDFVDDSGVPALTITDPDSRVYGIQSASLPVEVGNTYVLSALIAADAGGQGTIYLECFDSAGSRVGRANASVKDNWTLTEVQLTIPADAEYMYVRLVSQGAIVGFSAFKDVVLSVL